MKRIFYYTVLFQLILFSQCVDEIKLDIEGEEPRIVVDGLIANVEDEYTIRINKSAVLGRGTDNIFDPVAGADVKVVDGAGGAVTFAESEPGIYKAVTQALPGVEYHVDISLAGGKKILSKPSVLIPAPPITDVKAEVVDESELTASNNVVIRSNVVMMVSADFSEFEEKPFVRWRAQGEYSFREGYPGALNTKLCYVKNTLDINNLRIFDTRNLEGNLIIDEPFVKTEADFRFAMRYCIHVDQYAMSEEEFIYWDAVNDIINIDGSLFDPPPGILRGNLYNPEDDSDLIAGYFSVNGVSTVRKFITPSTLNRTDILPKCAIRFRFVPGPDCLDCLTITNSTLEKPSYWIQ